MTDLFSLHLRFQKILAAIGLTFCIFTTASARADSPMAWFKKPNGQPSERIASGAVTALYDVRLDSRVQRIELTFNSTDGSHVASLNLPEPISISRALRLVARIKARLISDPSVRYGVIFEEAPLNQSTGAPPTGTPKSARVVIEDYRMDKTYKLLDLDYLQRPEDQRLAASLERNEGQSASFRVSPVNVEVSYHPKAYAEQGIWKGEVEIEIGGAYRVASYAIKGLDGGRYAPRTFNADSPLWPLLGARGNALEMIYAELSDRLSFAVHQQSEVIVKAAPRGADSVQISTF